MGNVLVYLQFLFILRGDLEYSARFAQIDSQLFITDENDRILNHFWLERVEQILAFVYVAPTAQVLELGGRYGSVSYFINKKLVEPSKHVVIEPDSLVLKALYKNKVLNSCDYHIETSVLGGSDNTYTLCSDKFGTRTIRSPKNDHNAQQKILNVITPEEIQRKYDLKIDTLVVDCEGQMENILHEFPSFLTSIHTVVLEEDQPKTCSYKYVHDVFAKAGLKLVKQFFMWTVWKKM